MTELPTDSFRRTLSRFASGLVIITTQTEERAYGLTCQAFASVSLDPPLVGAFLTKDSGTLWAIDQTQKFAVSVLAGDQTEIARLFALRGADKFRDMDLIRSPRGLPVIANSLAWLECDVVQRSEAGDHVSLLGHVVEMENVRDTTPLVYWRGGYGSFT